MDLLAFVVSAINIIIIIFIGYLILKLIKLLDIIIKYFDNKK